MSILSVGRLSVITADQWRTRHLRHARLTIAVGSALSFWFQTPLCAQGLTTAAIRGSVRAENGANVDGTQLRVINRATGIVSPLATVHGSVFLVAGLETGGPYTVEIRRIGFVAQQRDSIFLALGESRQLDFTLVTTTGRLDTITVKSRDVRDWRPTSRGVGTSISDSMLRRLPTLNRDAYDMARTAPEVSTRFGLSGAGASFRLNNFLIDGVSDRQLQGNNAMGGPNGGKSISLEAVKELQVLLTPFDARYGDFTGLLVNSVTKSGTNELHGSAYGYMRSAQLARSNSFLGESDFEREQFGFSLGGPIVRDRAFFFIAPEVQRAMSPAPGPYFGQATDAATRLPVSAADAARFTALLRDKGLDPGDGGRVTLTNPNLVLFGRIDVALPEWKSRVAIRDNYSAVDVPMFARSTTSGAFPLSSAAFAIRTIKRATAVQFFTQPKPGLFNELQLSYTEGSFTLSPRTYSPSIIVSVPADSGFTSATRAQLSAGLPSGAGRGRTMQQSLEFGDHVVFQAGARHTLGVGAQLVIFNYHGTNAGNLGQWRFASLDALADGDATSYSIRKDFGDGALPVRGTQPSVYINDEWRIDDRLSVTIGLRADALNLGSRPRYNPAVDSIFGRRTSDYPATHVHWSPRLGFSWDADRDARTTVRGGAGLFVGRPPLGWLLGAARSNGDGIRTLTCVVLSPGQGSQKAPPEFVADPEQQPTTCADGSGFADGPVALVDRNLRMGESFRASLAIDHRLPRNTRATVTALFSKVRSDFAFFNENLAGPQGTDAHGRVMYGTILSSGVSRPTLVEGGRFPEVFDLRNTADGYSWSLTARLDKPFSDNVEAHLSYTYSKVRDAQTLTSGSALALADIWASQRAISGRHDVPAIGVSAFDIPHRAVLSVTYAARWKGQTTDISLQYVGQSGAPFTYGDSTAGGLGDLNADGTNANDPIYVPRNATDPSEMAFAGSDAEAQAHAVAFKQFIDATPCLRRQRGSIMARNSCRGSWINTSNLSVRQSLPAMGGHHASLQLEVFNVLNLLNSSWGLFSVPNAAILQHAGQTTGTPSQPTFRFDPANVRSTRNIESGYQLQISLRYTL